MVDTLSIRDVMMVVIVGLTFSSVRSSFISSKISADDLRLNSFSFRDELDRFDDFVLDVLLRASIDGAVDLKSLNKLQDVLQTKEPGTLMSCLSRGRGFDPSQFDERVWRFEMRLGKPSFINNQGERHECLPVCRAAPQNWGPSSFKELNPASFVNKCHIIEDVI
jgi:hypothetical protein